MEFECVYRPTDHLAWAGLPGPLAPEVYRVSGLSDSHSTSLFSITHSTSPVTFNFFLTSIFTLTFFPSLPFVSFPDCLFLLRQLVFVVIL